MRRVVDPLSVPMVLMYHAIAEPASAHEAGYTTPPAEFARQMAWLAEWGYVGIDVATLARCRAGGAPLPARAVVITFDDGFACLRDAAWPVLRRHGFGATVFLIAGKLGRSNDHDADVGVPERPLLGVDAIRAMVADGLDLGSHTLTHPDLTTLDDAALEREVAGSRALLRETFGVPVDAFAYPRGRFDRRVRDAVRAAGYRWAFSTIAGRNAGLDDPLLVRRAQLGAGHGRAEFSAKLRLGDRPLRLARAALGRGLRAARARLAGHDPLSTMVSPMPARRGAVPGAGGAGGAGAAGVAQASDAGAIAPARRDRRTAR